LGNAAWTDEPAAYQMLKKRRATKGKIVFLDIMILKKYF
jgi:hypothetical protein